MLNLENEGRNLAIIKGGRLDKKIVSVDTNENANKNYKAIELNENAEFQQIPNKQTEREILYITGPSGSGKSTYTYNYCKEYKKLFKNNEIYLLSALTEDESLDKIKPKRIKIDEQLITDPLEVSLFENSLVIFDDIDVIGDKKIREAVYILLNQVLEVGRHFHISCIITNHLPTNGKDTRRVLNEAHSITYFPHSGNHRGIKYLLENYLGVDKKTMIKAKKLRSRWATVFKNYPQIMMTQRNIWLLSDE